MKSKEMISSSPVRTGNQQATMSAKTRRLVKRYEENFNFVMAPAPCRIICLHDVRRFLQWLHERGLELRARCERRTSRRTRTGFSPRAKQTAALLGQLPTQPCLTAVKSFFRFL